MHKIHYTLTIVSLSLLASTQTWALPDDVAELKKIVAEQYNGNANLYVEDNLDDFKEMGCEGRTDLLATLKDNGLNFDGVSFATHQATIRCAIDEEKWEALNYVMTPDSIFFWEAGWAEIGHPEGPLGWAIRIDEYEFTKYLLERGAHFYSLKPSYFPLTREEQLIIAAYKATEKNKKNARRAFIDAGYGHIIAAAANKENINYINRRLGSDGVDTEDDDFSLMRAIGGLALGAQTGGSTGAAVGAILGASGALTQNGNSQQGSNIEAPPLPFETRRAKLGALVELYSDGLDGLLIQQIVPNGPAASAGMAAGDIIRAIDGIRVKTQASLYVATESAYMKEKFDITYSRDGRESVATLSPPLETEADTNPNQSKLTSSSTDILAELERLADLRDRGVLTEEEFKALKAKLLSK